jgi:DnaJ-class molecular chaperone
VIKFPGKGNQSASERRSGDLYVKVVVVPHEKFKLKFKESVDSKKPRGYIESSESITLVQAITGTKINADTIYGKRSLTIPAGTNYDDSIVIKGKVKEYDHVIKIRIDLPKDLDDKQLKGLYEYQQVEQQITRNY